MKKMIYLIYVGKSNTLDCNEKFTKNISIIQLEFRYSVFSTHTSQQRSTLRRSVILLFHS